MKTIKRYPNRKLYDTGESRYITLDEIGEYLREGGEVRVVDSRSGEDITSLTLAQVLLGAEKKSRPGVPMQRLLTLLQTGGDFFQRTIASPVTAIKDEAEKTVARLIHAEPPEELRDFVLNTHKAYEDIQHRVDERLQTVLATVRHMAPILKEVDLLREEVRQLNERIHYLETHLTLNQNPDNMAS